MSNDGSEIQEEFTVAETEPWIVSYVQTKHPLPFEYSRGTFHFEDGPATKVTLEAEFEFADKSMEEQLLLMLESGYEKTMGNLKQLLEEGD